jgi:hypothetical protein
MVEEVININFWKEIHKEISSTLEEVSGIVLITHNSIKFPDIIDILNATRPNQTITVLYISLTRSYEFMKSTLNQKKPREKQLFFIDCVSGFAFPKDENIDDCIYHKPPSNLNEMKEIINLGIQKSNPDIILIDSLSQFINFSRPTETKITDLYQFLRTIRESGLNIVQDTYMLFYDNQMDMMINLPKRYTDLILKIEVSKEEALWKD